MIDITSTQPEKFRIQDAQYEFPYHYIPHLDKTSGAQTSRRLSWGLEYLVYMEHVREIIRELRPKSLIDVGCGDGVLAGTLAKEIDVVLGVDLSERAISFARAFWPGVNFDSMPVNVVSEVYDCAAAIEVLEHIPDEIIPDFIRDVENVLAPGGNFVVSVPSTVLKIRKKHYRHYTENLLRQQVEKNASSLKMIRVEFVYFEPIDVRILKMLIWNRYFSINIPLFSRLLWKKAWTKRLQPPERGSHVVAVFKKGG